MESRHRHGEGTTNPGREAPSYALPLLPLHLQTSSGSWQPSKLQGKKTPSPGTGDVPSTRELNLGTGLVLSSVTCSAKRVHPADLCVSTGNVEGAG